MDLYKELIENKAKLSVIGLGYVGLPIAVAFSKKLQIIAYDYNEQKISLYRQGIDPTNEVGNNELKQAKIDFTAKADKLKEAHFHIIAVPTPVNKDHTPDLSPILNASQTLGKFLQKESIVIYESTVYPGVTEEICVPILEKESGLKCGLDFKIGYSPERINPGDKIHRLETIIKIVSGMDEETLNIVAQVYELVAKAGVYRAPSIKVAEAAKVIENSQRDINIAFMNELSMIFHRMNIDTQEVLKAAGTKWNFLKFQPGLVGGHCIGVDPYYLTYKAESLGYHSQIILSGRRINDNMGKYVAENLVKRLIHQNIAVKNAKVAILGFAFKENCPDTRNTKVIDIYRELKDYGIDSIIIDPIVDNLEVKKLYGIELKNMDSIKCMDAVIIAVAHRYFVEMTPLKLIECYESKHQKKILFDLKGIYDKNECEFNNFDYWRL